MKKLIFSLFLVAIAAINLSASDIQVDGIWYDFSSSSKTASVTYRGRSYFSYSNEYSGSIVIPETVIYNSATYSVTTIGYEAFKDCSGLTSVTIPNSITTIGYDAFRNCSSLTSVTIPNSVTTIGDNAFGGSGLTSPLYNASCFVYMPESYKGAYTIPNGIKQIAGEAFSNCSSLTSVTIPNSVTTIGYGAFEYCSGLTAVTIPNSITTIEGHAFGWCEGLTSVTIPNSVTTIGGSAFWCCSGLTSVTIPNSVTMIEYGTFYYCRSLISVTIPNSVTTIGELAFCECSSLTSVTIPNSVTTIGRYAFRECSELTSVTIPNSVTTIGEGAFSDCEILTSINVDAANMHYCSLDGVLFNYAKDTLIQYPAGKSQTEYTIPNSVTTIGDYAFYGCYGLTSVTIGNSVTTIGDYAFSDCYGLTSVTIGNSVTTIGEEAFYGCTRLTSIDVDAANTHYASTDGVLFNYAKDTLIQYPSGNLRTEYTIPNSVTTIGEWAFSGCGTRLTSITIPNSVTTIGEWAFSDCSGLTSITCYAQNPPICGSYCFYKAPKDIPLYIPCNASLSAYQSAEGWKDFINIVKLYSGACGKDLHWKYKEGTLSISGTGEMYDFTQTDSPWLDLKDSVTNITFPSNITSIGENAFYGFSKLTSVTIPNSVIAIGGNAFRDCSGLTSVIIGNSVTTIGDGAFYGCKNIRKITCFAKNPPVCGTTEFSDLSQYTKVYVLASSLEDYQFADVWRDLNLYPIESEVVPISGDQPIVVPTDNNVTITWPITDGTDTYTLTISKNGETVCVLTFNAQGQLVNIAFKAPAADGAHQAPAATLTAQGYQFTVTGLTPGTAYDYCVTATDAGGKTIAEHNGNFSTTGGESGLQNVRNGAKASKYFHDGNLIIERNGIKYTPAGQKVR